MTPPPLPWFSDPGKNVDQPLYCLVCWAHGGVITRHRAHPVEAPAAKGGSAR